METNIMYHIRKLSKDVVITNQKGKVISRHKSLEEAKQYAIDHHLVTNIS